MIDWAAIAAFHRAARARCTWPGPEKSPVISVGVAQALAHRACAQHLDARLTSDELAQAAAPGLQDSAPRAGLLGLHARVTDVGPDAWEHPSLVQIWFRLGADYVIPHTDADMFTVGTMPTDGDQVAALNALGDLVRDTCDGEPRRSRDLLSLIGDDLPDRYAIRTAQVSGKIRIRWDARTTHVIPVDDPPTDPDDARVDLVRRFVRTYGPVTPSQFGRWAAMTNDAVRIAFDAIDGDLAAVDVDGERRFVLASEVDALRTAVASTTVRLLPGVLDAYLYLDVPPAPFVPEVGPDVTQRLVNSLVGRVLLDGEFVGAWGRVQGDVTIFPWRPLRPDDVARIDAEASSFAGPIGRPIRIRWLAPVR